MRSLRARPARPSRPLNKKGDPLGGMIAGDPRFATNTLVGRVVRLLDLLLSRLSMTPSTQRYVKAMFVLSLALVAWIDYMIGPGDIVSTEVLYVLPVVLAVILVSGGFGLLIEAEAVTVWALSDALDAAGPNPPLGSVISTSLLRFVILAGVVLLLAALRFAVDEARFAERRSQEFLKYAAHQIRTPLAGLQGSAESLILAGVSPSQERLLTHIVAESQRVGRLVAGMLRMARLDEHEPLPVCRVDPAALCQAEVDLARGRARSGIEVALHVEPGTNLSVEVSPEATREALGNLLDNARRYAQTRVDVSLTSPDHRVMITVTDDGPGLAEGTEERAFDRFVSLDGQGGAGLGLSIARALITAQGGQLVYSQRRFIIGLPAGRSSEAKK
jgi:signal transduction histidine kinase